MGAARDVAASAKRGRRIVLEKSMFYVWCDGSGGKERREGAAGY